MLGSAVQQFSTTDTQYSSLCWAPVQQFSVQCFIDRISVETIDRQQYNRSTARHADESLVLQTFAPVI